MTADWSALDAALERNPPTVWWRDDDAVEPTPALDRLIDLADRVGAPLTLAVVPAKATPALGDVVTKKPISIAVHGWAHASHAPKSEKKAEFGAHRPDEALVLDARRGKARIDDLFGSQALSLFVPPWNRMAATLSEHLSALGFNGVSTFAQREVSWPTPDMVRLDAHIDPIDWRGTRSAVPTQSLVDHVAELLAIRAPIGLMTHHLAHDEAIWELTEMLAARLTRSGARWVSVADLIDSAMAGETD